MDPDDIITEYYDQMTEEVEDEPDENEEFEEAHELCRVCGDPLLHDADIEAGCHFFCEPPLDPEDHDGG